MRWSVVLLAIAAVVLLGACQRSENKIEATPTPTVAPTVEKQGLTKEVLAEIDRFNNISLAERQPINWAHVPAEERRVRITTGKVVFNSTDRRLIVSHYPNGQPRFLIQQVRPYSVGGSSPKEWIVYGYDLPPALVPVV